MDSRVSWQEKVVLDLLTWIRAAPGHEGDRAAFAVTFLDDIREELEKCHGREAKLLGLGANRVVGLAPPTYDWLYSQWQVRFVVEFGYRRRAWGWLLRGYLRRWFPPSRCRTTLLWLYPPP